MNSPPNNPFAGAVDCMLEDAGFYAPISDQLSFF